MRDDQLKTIAALSAAALAAALAGPAAAKDVKVDVDGKFYQLPEGAKNNLDAVRVLLTAANGLGMARVATWQNDITENDGSRMCVGCTTDMYEYKGSGLFDGQQAKVVSIHFDLRTPAARIDVTGADGVRTVTVVKDKLTWDEKTPGVFKATSTASPTERLLPVYLFPPAAVVYGAIAADKITASKTDNANRRTLTVPVAALATELLATIDGNGYIVHTEFRYGGKVYSGDYTDYTNDRMDYHVNGPHHIVQKVDGKVVTDLQLEYHWVNPYVVFPTPKEVVASK